MASSAMTDAADNGRLVTTREVAEWLGVSPKTVLVWTGAGKLPGFRMPSGALRFDREELERWLEEQRR